MKALFNIQKYFDELEAIQNRTMEGIRDRLASQKSIGELGSNMKITIEGWKDEPVVLEGVKQFVLCSANEKNGCVAACCESAFWPFAIYELASAFKKCIK